MASSPSLGPAAEIFSQVIIEANDNANGLLSLSTSAVSVEEQRTEPFLYVNRTAGSFGEVCQLILSYADCYIVQKLEKPFHHCFKNSIRTCDAAICLFIILLQVNGSKNTFPTISPYDSYCDPQSRQLQTDITSESATER